MVAVFGTTGVQTKIHKYTIDALKNTKKTANGKIPVGIGFGISTEKDVQKYVSSWSRCSNSWKCEHKDHGKHACK